MMHLDDAGNLAAGPRNLEALRAEFDAMRPEFVRQYAGTAEAARRFSASQVRRMARTGRLPGDWIVHHKIPLGRGGANVFENFRVMRESFHLRFSKRLHYYLDGANIYQ